MIIIIQMKKKTRWTKSTVRNETIQLISHKQEETTNHLQKQVMRQFATPPGLLQHPQGPF